MKGLKLVVSRVCKRLQLVGGKGRGASRSDTGSDPAGPCDYGVRLSGEVASRFAAGDTFEYTVSNKVKYR